MPPDARRPDLGTGRNESSIPPWAGQELSWAKLEDLEHWLKTDGRHRGSFWRLEGTLQLAEGRLQLAKRDGAVHFGNGSKGNTGAKAPEVLGTRARAAEAGFRRVLADPAANAAQEARARQGLSQASHVLTGVVSRVASGVATTIFSRSQWSARAARPRKMTRAGGGWNRITIHHSAEASPRELDGSLEASAQAVRSIQRVHMTGAHTGYGDIGYHFLIDPVGRVFEGRALDWQGAHASGTNNRNNLGVCLLGNFEHDRPSADALAALERLVDELTGRMQTNSPRILAHLELKNTLCPGRYMMTWLNGYRARLAQGYRPPGNTGHAGNRVQRQNAAVRRTPLALRSGTKRREPSPSRPRAVSSGAPVVR